MKHLSYNLPKGARARAESNPQAGFTTFILLFFDVF